MNTEHPVSGEPLHDPHYARGNETYSKMLGDLESDECGLCTLRVHSKPVLLRAAEGTDHEWLITERFEVPEGVDQYFLIMPKRHIENVAELQPEDFAALNALIRWAETRFNLDGFGLILRSGTSIRTGATCVHLHFHLIMPAIDPVSGRAIPYYFPIG